MSPGTNFWADVIAIYWSPLNGTEMHFRRDGRCFWRYAGKKEFERVLDPEGNPLSTTFEHIEKWLKDDGVGFVRVGVDLSDLQEE